jgi:hypothetical protein
MNSRERLQAAWTGQPGDHIPLTTSCFGFQAPPSLRWERDGQPIRYWYSLRMEHIHTLDQPWELEDDFRRVLAWRSLGVDDLLDVSIPWSIDHRVKRRDSVLPPGAGRDRPLLVRDYETPNGRLRHAVWETAEDHHEGWVKQPDHAPLFEDFNLPRAARHAVSRLSDIPLIAYLYQTPDAAARAWFEARMERIRPFAISQGVPVQAWSAFGMDAVVWLVGGVEAVMLAMDHPKEFGQLVDIVAEADYGRTELAAASPGIDMIVQRGWYSSTDLWSPRLFDAFVFSHLKNLADLAHQYGKKFAYVMTTGVERLGSRLADAGVDVLYFLDPLQDGVSPERARLLSERMTLVGGINALSLSSCDERHIRDQVNRALEILGPSRRFVLHPVDALFPDTPWEGVEMMIDAWRAGQP